MQYGARKKEPGSLFSPQCVLQICRSLLNAELKSRSPPLTVPSLMHIVRSEKLSSFSSSSSAFFGGTGSRGSLLLLPIYASFLSRRSQSVRVTQKWKSESSCPANVNSESVAALAFAVYTRNSSGETNEWPGPGGVNGWQTSIFLGFLSTVHSNFVALFNNRRSESYRRMEMERLRGKLQEIRPINECFLALSFAREKPEREKNLWW